MGILTDEAVSTDFMCAGISSLPSIVCVYHGSFSFTNRSNVLLKSCSTEGSAFSLMAKPAEVCLINTCRIPVSGNACS